MFFYNPPFEIPAYGPAVSTFGYTPTASVTFLLCDDTAIATRIAVGGPHSHGVPKFYDRIPIYQSINHMGTRGVLIIGGPYIYLTPGSNIAVRLQWIA